MILTKKLAYEKGRDYAINGANMDNCDFRIFTSDELKEAWENGKNSVSSSHTH